MTIDWNHFTPWMSLAGGIVLGLASALFILFNGRVLGISGIVGGLLRPKTRDIVWRLTFLLGMLVAPSMYVAFIGPLNQMPLGASERAAAMSGQPSPSRSATATP